MAIQNLDFPSLNLATDDPEAIKVLEIIKMYFDSNVNSKIELFQEITHPNFIRFGLGNSNELYYMSRDEVINQSLIGLSKARESIPNFKCSFKIKKITHITIHDIIASIGVEWEMMMIDSVGIHCTCFHLAKEGGKWILVNALDRGKEVLKQNP